MVSVTKIRFHGDDVVVDLAGSVPTWNVHRLFMKCVCSENDLIFLCWLPRSWALGAGQLLHSNSQTGFGQVKSGSYSCPLVSIGRSSRHLLQWSQIHRYTSPFATFALSLCIPSENFFTAYLWYPSEAMAPRHRETKWGARWTSIFLFLASSSSFLINFFFLGYYNTKRDTMDPP